MHGSPSTQVILVVLFYRVNHEERFYDDEADFQLKEIPEDYDFELKQNNRFENKQNFELEQNQFENDMLNDDEDTLNKFLSKNIPKNVPNCKKIHSSSRLLKKEKKQQIMGENVVMIKTFLSSHYMFFTSWRPI